MLRLPGTLHQVAGNGIVSNIYNLKIVNKTHDEIPLEIKILSHEGVINKTIKGEIIINNHAMYENVIIIEFNSKVIKSGKNTIEMAVYSNGEEIETFDIGFLAP